MRLGCSASVADGAGNDEHRSTHGGSFLEMESDGLGSAER